MGNVFATLFGSSQEDTRITDQDRAIADLKGLQTSIDRQKRRYEVLIRKETEAAIQFKKVGNKAAALRCLKLKRYQCDLIAKAEDQYMSVQSMIDSIELADINKKVLDGIKRGNDALKQLQEGFSVEHVEDLLLDVEDSIQKQNEIDDLLKGAMFTVEDEEELLEELSRITTRQEKESKPKQKDVDVDKHVANVDNKGTYKDELFDQLESLEGPKENLEAPKKKENIEEV